VRAVARHHGGRVTVRSREGQGTAFTLRLPRSPDAM
jgi:signal transduction histidine kinase